MSKACSGRAQPPRSEGDDIVARLGLPGRCPYRYLDPRAVVVGAGATDMEPGVVRKSLEQLQIAPMAPRVGKAHEDEQLVRIAREHPEIDRRPVLEILDAARPQPSEQVVGRKCFHALVSMPSDPIRMPIGTENTPALRRSACG